MDFQDALGEKLNRLVNTLMPVILIKAALEFVGRDDGLLQWLVCPRNAKDALESRERRS
jgi:hypothetical protein